MCVCGQNKHDESCWGLSLDLFHSLLRFVVERALVAETYDAQVFLARALEKAMNGRSVMDIEATGLKRVPGRNGFLGREGGEGNREHRIARVSFKRPCGCLPVVTTQK